MDWKKELNVETIKVSESIHVKMRIFADDRFKGLFDDVEEVECSESFYVNGNHTGKEFLRERKDVEKIKCVRQDGIGHGGNLLHYQEVEVLKSAIECCVKFMSYKFKRKSYEKDNVKIYYDKMELPFSYEVITISVIFSEMPSLDVLYKTLITYEFFSRVEYHDETELVDGLKKSIGYLPVSTKFMLVLRAINEDLYLRIYKNYDASSSIVSAKLQNFYLQNLKGKNIRTYVWHQHVLPSLYSDALAQVKKKVINEHELQDVLKLDLEDFVEDLTLTIDIGQFDY